MELFYIFKYKFLIFKHRVQQIKLIYTLIIMLMAALLIPAIFVGNMIFLKVMRIYFDFSSSDYFFVINLVNGVLIFFMTPYLIKKSYSNNFKLEKDYILYTSPLSLKTIFFYKFILCNNKVIIPIAAITIPNIITYGIINESSILQIIMWVITLMILVVLISTIIQLLTVIISVIISAKYRTAFVNIFASAISIAAIVGVLAIEKIYGIGQIYNYLKTDSLIKKVFFVFDTWSNLSINFELGKLDISSLLILILGCIIFIAVYFCLYKLMYLKGEFIKNNTDTSIKAEHGENAFYIVLKNIFKETYVLIYKDILLLTRSIEKWGVIIRPIVFTPLPFLGADDFFSYETISEILVILFIWLSSDLAVHSVRNEGAMLNQLKNSSFNIRNVIYSKIAFTSIISITMYIFVSIVMLLFLNFNFYQLFILGMSVIGAILTTSTVRASCSMLYAKESSDSSDEYSVTLGFKGEILSYLFMFAASGVVIGISMISLYITSTITSWLSLLIFVFTFLIEITFVVAHLKFFTKIVSNKIISLEG